MEYLSDQQIKEFEKYKHFATKTTLETYYIDKLLVNVEKKYPKVKCLD